MAANWAAQDARLDSDIAMVARLRGRPANDAQGQKAKPVVELIEASSLVVKPIHWLWPGWLARGKLHVLAGAPGTGKTTISMELAACVSSGRSLPGGFTPKRGRVLIWSGEDDPSDTLVPRLKAAGADLSKIRFVGDIKAGSERNAFDPSRDVPKLVEAVGNDLDVALIVVDPIVSAVPGDSHKNAEVRRGLAPLVDLATRLDAALLGITHYSKGTQGRDPLERVSGSLAFGAVARVVWGTVKQQADEGQPSSLMLARAKSNIGPDGGGFVYAYEQVEVPGSPGVLASRVVWGAPVEGSARELLSEVDADDEGMEGRDAAEWLRDLLADGPIEVKAIRKQGDDSGFSWRTLQRAMRRAGVVSKRGGFGLPATWSLASRATAAPVAPLSGNGANGANGTDLARLDSDSEAFDL
jgi:putative DNA primase/helicase